MNKHKKLKALIREEKDNRRDALTALRIAGLVATKLRDQVGTSSMDEPLFAQAVTTCIAADEIIEWIRRAEILVSSLEIKE